VNSVDDALSESCGGEARVRLPATTLAAVHVVTDAENDEVAGETFAIIIGDYNVPYC